MISDYFDGCIPVGTEPCLDKQFMEFHINARIRRQCDFDETLFASSGNVIFTNLKAVRLFAQKYNDTIDAAKHPDRFLKAGQLNAMGLIDEIFHYVCRLYRRDVSETFFSGAIEAIEEELGVEKLDAILLAFVKEFPPLAVYRNSMDPAAWLAESDDDGISNRVIALEELMLLRLANENPAFEPFYPLFTDKVLLNNKDYLKAWDILRQWSAKKPPFGPENRDLISMLKAPVEFSPYDLKGQLDYIRKYWLDLLGEWLSRLLSGIDLISEEEKASWSGGIGSGTPEMSPYEFGDISKEYERFSPDRDWMPNVVLIAKSTLVWLSQLTEKYGRPITRLDQIPDEELDFIASCGFTGLWLIGLWERSYASARIKQICGNPEAAASAYSLYDYDIAEELGGWEALNNLRMRAWKRGIRMASDMVPNHTGMDGKWVIEKPDLFVQTRDCPFPSYDFNGENLSRDNRVSIYLENHYYSRSDCAVVFKRVDNHTGDVRYIYHGNDGTGMPWNDTAQIDFLNPEAREEVIQKIMHVARNFPIIRFDAAMVLAKKHIQRLWYPEPGHGGDIASRSQFALSRDEFERRIPEEFWREVVDRCAKEIPDTLLLAEAFWMMEGYFVRTLGMHRVYNSAFMNMLKREDNAKYRDTIKNTIEFDSEILKRYVNFMNNPDEETAAVQFGYDDKYFGVCTMMVAMPGLPMFGHGQIEGFEEKYGMEYRKAYRNEQPKQWLVDRHRREIFPLMKKRYLFAGVDNFLLYDFYENGRVNENVFAWSNRVGDERALVLYNNKYEQATGWIKTSAARAIKNADGSKTLVQSGLAEGIGLTVRDNRYCIMQELRSGLWFMRTTRELANNGIFASLNGFQTQVFMNIYEVDDNEFGHYRTLYETLNGAGITDIQMGIKNIFLKDLYTALAGLASAEYFNGIRDILFMKDAKDLDTRVTAFTAGLKKPAQAFFEKCGEYISGAFGAQSIIDLSKRKNIPDAATVWEWYSASLERLLRLGTDPEKTIGAGLPVEGDYPEILACTLILYSVRPIIGSEASGEVLTKLIDLWSLDRKLADILSGYGKNGGHILWQLQKVKATCVLTGLENEPAPASDIMGALFTYDGARQFLGLNEWDGITWFNKEQAEEMINILTVLSAIFGIPGEKTADNSPEGIKGHFKSVLDMRKKMGEILDGAEYQADKVTAEYRAKKTKTDIKDPGKEKKDSGPAKTKK
ncbi:alpha-amylase [Brucepastera parasyntrophica]|uniref:alpha-amylase family glycosyl hydrolase n=1 Tax=Brucepastera parasyntrophica TaxID=2880008 RepID=UPI002109B72D|nr:alpha-amylase family glycosyl hydrolase [Brucepastera parasyntrophica]ULQ59011.1 alpha-amylase [Brucepastera parasyntrophica]